MNKYNITKEKLEDLYLGQNKSQQKIADMCGCSITSIFHLMKKYNIKSRMPYKINPEIDLSKEELEIIYGELLGDGCLHIGRGARSKNAVFRHGSEHKNYEIYLIDNLDFLKDRNIYKDKNGNYHIRSLTSLTLTRIYNNWYPNDEKHIWLDIKITPTVLRHWYLGDGHLAKKRGIFLYTNCFPKKEQLSILIPQLNKLGFNTRLYKMEQKSGKIQYYIYILRESVKKFLDYIGPCPKELQKEFGYKWDGR